MRIIRFRRRLENKTDYKARQKLLASNLPRIIIRKTNKQILAQIVTSKEAQDYIVCAVESNELNDFGWKLSKKNLPAAYLAGFLLGMKCKKAKEKIKKAILDIGLQRSTKGSKIYSALKGFIDAGIEVKCSQDMFPSEERIKGSHINKEIASEFEKAKSMISEKLK